MLNKTLRKDAIQDDSSAYALPAGQNAANEEILAEMRINRTALDIEEYRSKTA